MAELLKAVYVSVAEKEFSIPGREQTDSRITLLTSVHRKDVRKLRGMALEAIELSQPMSLGASLISHWLGTPALRSPAGKPLPIPRLRTAEPTVSFEDIVSMFTQDIRPRALLDEYVQQGILSVDHNDMVHLHMEALVPDKNLEAKSYFFAQTIHDHIAAASHNLMGEKPPFLDRYVWGSELSEKDAACLSVIAEKAAMRALKAINQSAVEFEQASADSGSPRNFRIHFGTFYYSTPNTVPGESGPQKPEQEEKT